MQVLNNSPSAGYIAWSDAKISYKGVINSVADGNTNLSYVYWKYSDPTTFYGSNNFPVLGPDDLMVFLNKNGTYLLVPNATIIEGSLIVPESILANAISANAVTAEKIMAGAINADKLSANSVGANAIAANVVAATHMVAGTITAVSGIIGTAAITTANIANLAVGNAAIANLAVTNAKIGLLAVGTAQIADLTVTNAKIGNLAVDNAKIADLAVTNAKIDDLAVTSAKIVSLNADKIVAITLSAITADLGVVTAGSITGVTFKTSNSSNNVTIENDTITSVLGTSYGTYISGGMFSSVNYLTSKSIEVSGDTIDFSAVGTGASTASIVVSDGKLSIDCYNILALSALDISIEGYTTVNSSLKVSDGIGVGITPSTGYSIDAFGRAYGIRGRGTTMGGRFEDSDGTSTVYCAYGDWGIYTAQNAYFGGSVGIGSTALSHKLYVNGTSYFGGLMTIASSIQTNIAETGFCGVGGVGGGLAGACAGTGVNFKITKTYLPSSVTMTAASSNRTALIINITNRGFWLYIEATGNTSFLYWRGTYAA